MCHQDIKKLLLALQGTVTSGDPTKQAIFFPTYAKLKT